MPDRMNPPEGGRPYRWRPAVTPFRPQGVRRLRRRRPAAGQMLLPGIELGEESAQAAEPIATDTDPIHAPEVPTRSTEAEACKPTLHCPNCGATEFDEDGDCIKCWEPGVARTDTKPGAEEA